MTQLSHYLKRPKADWSPAVQTAFNDLFRRISSSADGSFIEYTLAAPKWQFLCHLAECHDVVVHGSGSPDIGEFEPRQSNDSKEFGNQQAVYAASDGLWAMYFAIVDRGKLVRSLVNSCFQIVGHGPETGRRYYFSINADALPHDPWRTGYVYILPRSGFERERSSQPKRESTQWRSFSAVTPIAKLQIEPSDFPFLDQIRGHDPAVVNVRARNDPDGFPWLDE